MDGRHLDGVGKELVLINHHDLALTSPGIRAIAGGDYISKSIDEIRGSGYVVESLEAALWCFHHTNSFEEAILKAANLGDDADTTAAICGQVAGAYYGAEGIPARWLEKLVNMELISKLAEGLYRAAHSANFSIAGI